VRAAVKSPLLERHHGERLQYRGDARLVAQLSRDGEALFEIALRFR
jgi:hypothetical protein